MQGAYSSSSNPSGVQGVCPDGWHVPSDEEWEELAQYISNDNGGYSKWEGDNDGVIDDWGYVGVHLKATSGWSSERNNGTDDYGFSGLPGGYSSGSSGNFINIGVQLRLWSASDDGTGYESSAWYRYLYGYGSGLFYRNYGGGKGYGFSVRCLRD
jgi:uncharacterized protein (TIGR02145 family)